MTQVTRPCPICGACDAALLYSNVMAPLDGLDMSNQVARCASCGFIFANRCPSASTFIAYYRSLSKYDVAPGTAEASPADRLRCAAAIRLLRSHADFDAKIADLGCGSGRLLGAFQAAGWSRLAGVDPAPGAPEQARSQFGLDCVRCGTLEEAPNLIDLATMDVVCLTGVLEHLPRIRDDMETLVDTIGNSTKILIEVPALERFGRPPFEPYGEFSLEHIQYFSAESLVHFFDTLGFVPLSITLTDLPPGYCDSLFGLFARRPTGQQATLPTTNAANIEKYIAQSESMTQAALARIAACPAEDLVIYGAGSHTARLLPRLQAAGERRLAGLVDSNPNLCGKRLGPLCIEVPEALDRYPHATIVVSSFRSQLAICDVLQATYPNRVLALY